MTPLRTGLRIGTAPDSWGVWFADDPRQIPWNRFLDEVQLAGYTWIELGPYGYLPTDPPRLADELASRGLKLSAGTIFTGFHKGADQWQRAWDDALKVAGLASELGVDQLVVIPDMWRDEATGRPLEPRVLDNECWHKLTSGHDRLGKALLEEFGVQQQFHPHADTHVGTYREVVRFLQQTDAAYTNLCLDTGHFAYYGGDSLRLAAAHPERIGYLHLKQVDIDLLFDVLKDDLPFATAVGHGVMTEPPNGVPEFAPIIESVADLNPQIFAIVEQDMYPVDPSLPLPIAIRTREHILSCTQRSRLD